MPACGLSQPPPRTRTRSRLSRASEKFLGAELASPKRWKEMATQLEVNVKLPRRGSANV